MTGMLRECEHYYALLASPSLSSRAGVAVAMVLGGVNQALISIVTSTGLQTEAPP